MNISLTSELEALVHSKVKSGRYLSSSEVVREALRLLEDRDKLQAMRLNELRGEIQKGIDSGPSKSLDMEKIKKKARKCLSKGK